ncbi:hypothetical protein MKZ02_23905 [Pseudobacillus sp. FSL P4-0506]|uniref:hypothetical protein n=1 Tax=unclassified Pseudobacillus TaxID=2619284 RepID=UPI0030F59006
MLKKLLMLSFVFIFSLALLSPSANAEKNDVTDSVMNDKNNDAEYFIVDEDGNTLMFENKEDYDKYNSTMHNSPNNPPNLSTNDAPTNSEITPYAYKETKTLISSTRKNNLWVGYHSGTPNWSKASRYTLQNGKTYSVNGSYTYEGVRLDIGFSYSKSVTTTIPADSKRYSRLGVWGDFTFKKYKITVHDPIGKWSYYKAEKTRHNYYIQPKYK